ncbi:hypothetical protein EWH23_15845 [Meiothermus sp. PNK-Is4]|nr:hypothetical protein DNA98_16760 [Meiothermus sp. Pnk-1]RYM29962.1 hypothetical protein EWH23_15845 [Meiothermus sp. PNK-Is4]
MTLAQGVRQQGLGGLILPGPEAAPYNPAYAAYPPAYAEAEGFRLPLGLLRMVLPLFPETNAPAYFYDRQTFKQRFDALSFYDQLTHLDSFLFNPARSPDEVVFSIGQNEVRITDGQGNPLNLDFSVGGGGQTISALTPPPLLRLPLETGVPGLGLELGLIYGSGGLGVEASEDLKQAVGAGDLSRCRSATPSPCALTGRTNFISGLGLNLAYATPLPELPDFAGKLYAGVRGEGFYGLGYLEAQATARPTFDQNGNPNGTDYEVRYFYSVPGNGQGFGVRADAGVVVDYQGFTLGLGVRNLVGFIRWSGTEVTVQNGSSSQTPAERQSGGFAPALFLNGAYRLPLEEGSLLVGADFSSLDSSFHLGAEYALGPYRLRAGAGLEGGFKFGLGGGVRLEGFSLDTALTVHQAPVVRGTVYGLALSLGF